MLAFSVAFVALLATSPDEAALPSATSCPATAMLEEAQALVPASEDTRQTRAQIGYGLSEARGSEGESDRKARLQRCRAALLAYAEVAGELPELGPPKAERARELAGDLEAEIATIEVIEPQLDPETAWIRRKRALTAGVAVTGVLTSAGMLMATVPWMTLNSCRNPDPDFGCGEGYIALIISTTGGALALISAIPLIVWAVRLDRHRDARPPGLTILRGRGRLELAGAGLRLKL